MANAGGEYAAFIGAQLAEDRATKSSLEARGITVITTSGGLITLLFGLVALATNEAATYTLPDPAPVLLIGAALLLTAAGACGLLTNWALSYREATVDGMNELLQRDWDADLAQGQLDVAATIVAIIGTSRDKNDEKANLLRAALVFEILGVICVAAAAIVVLTS
jgi:hypothetical protein